MTKKKSVKSNENGKKLFIINNIINFINVFVAFAKEIVVLCAAFGVVVSTGNYKEVTTVKNMCLTGLVEVIFIAVVAICVMLFNYLSYFKGKESRLIVLTVIEVISLVVLICLTVGMFL